MKRAVIYARYSSNNQTEQSIEGQIRVCMEYAGAKGLTVVGTYVDRAVSGKTDNRPDFQRLIADCGKKLFEAVIVYRTDRFARNKYDSAVYKQKLKKAGIQLHYAAEPIPDGPEGIILESLLEGLAEYYSAELGQKIRRGKRESALKTLYPGGPLAFGYEKGDNKTIVKDDVKAVAVQTAFTMYINGETCTSICAYLNGTGFRTWTGGKFTPLTVTRMIQNEAYIGVYKCGEIRTEDAIPVIVEKDTFLVAQSEMAKRRVVKQTNLPKADYLLSGKLFCGLCKAKMTGVSGTSGGGIKHYYYYCPNKRRSKTCDKKQVVKDWLEDLVMSETLNYVLQPAVIRHIAKQCRALQMLKANLDDRITILKRRAADNKKALAGVTRAIESGVETVTLPARLRELEIEKAAIDEELKRVEASHLPLTEKHIEFMLSQYVKPRDGESEYEHKKNVLACFVSEVYLYADKIIIVYNLSQNDSGFGQSEIALLENGAACSTSEATA